MRTSNLFPTWAPWVWSRTFHARLNYGARSETRRNGAKTHLVSLFTTRHGTSEWLLVPSVHAHRTEDGLGADGALCGPRLVAVRLLEVHVLLLTLATCEIVKCSLG